MFYKILNLVMFVVMVTINYLANVIPLNNKTTGELSAQYPNLFVPAGVTFSIWGVIYILLLVFVAMQFLGTGKAFIKAIGLAFAISCLLNAAWIFAWHYEQLPLSLILMAGLLITLIFINFKIESDSPVLIKAAFGIYLGWICIAAIANVTAFLVSYNWDGWGISQEAWAIIMIGIGALITALAIMRLENPFIGLAVVWAFIGIIIKRQSDYQSIVLAAIAGIVIVSVITVWMFMKGGYGQQRALY